MTFDPDDFQDQAAMLAALQRQRQLDLLSQKQVIPKNRACPWCGGELPGVVKKCMHCTSNVSWFEGQPCTPEDLKQLEKESQERGKYLNEKTRCHDCESEFIRKNLTDGRCRRCTNKFYLEQEKDARKSTEVGCLIAFLLLVIPLLYFGSGVIAKGFPVILELGIGIGVFWLIIFVVIFLVTWKACESIFCGVLSLIILLLFLSMMLSGV
jgi:hypothetical protein